MLVQFQDHGLLNIAIFNILISWPNSKVNTISNKLLNTLYRKYSHCFVSFTWLLISIKMVPNKPYRLHQIIKIEKIEALILKIELPKNIANEKNI